MQSSIYYEKSSSTCEKNSASKWMFCRYQEGFIIAGILVWPLCYSAVYCEPSYCVLPSSISGECVTTEVQTLEHDGTVSEYTYHGQCKYVGKADKGLTNSASGYLNAVINIWFIPMKSMCVEGGVGLSYAHVGFRSFSIPLSLSFYVCG